MSTCHCSDCERERSCNHRYHLGTPVYQGYGCQIACSLPVFYQETEIKKPTMKTLNSMIKRLLDNDTKVLIKGGLINGDLELTSEGIKELQALLFMANKEELVKVAQAIIDEDKK